MAFANRASQIVPPSHRRRRAPEDGVLYRVLAKHLETFLNRAGDRLPEFIAIELRKYLHCGILAAGFARVHCSGCGRDELVAFSGVGVGALTEPGDVIDMGNSGTAARLLLGLRMLLWVKK